LRIDFEPELQGRERRSTNLSGSQRGRVSWHINCAISLYRS